MLSLLMLKPQVWMRSLLGFTLTVPQSVSVQEGLCVLVPCNFKYPASYDTKNSPARLYRYWYKDPADVGRNPPVASSDPSRLVTQETQGRFRLAENPARGDCSVQISDARQTDAGRYFLRVEGDFKYTYRTSADGTDLTDSLPSPGVSGLTEKPEIQISPARGLPGTLLAGEPVTVTCTAPGRCSGTPPRVTWMGPFSDTARNVSAQLANGTWAHSSALSFTPTPGKHGKELVCSVTYRPPWGPSTSKTVQLHVVYPSAGIPTLGLPRPAPLGTEGDIVSLETQEGDSLNLSCEASSRPEATLSWAKGNESLSPGQGGAGHLELPNLSRGDAGEYRCWAKNSYGSASRALRVHVQSKVLGGACATQRGLSGGYWAAGGWGKRGLGQPMQSAQQGGCKSLPGVSALLLTQHHKTPAAHQTKGIQDGAATAQAPLGPGEPDELHYAAIDFSKLQRKGAEPPEAPATEYSAVRWK
uniref:Ig-like domain-containing protein n=1 Tax=Chrysemys picta bellii TaxID=8478 RepID=A0A8C3PA83_CHRPI